MGFKFTWKDSGPLVDGRLVARISNGSAKIAKTMAERMVEILTDYFQSGGTPEGDWELLSDITLALNRPNIHRYSSGGSKQPLRYMVKYISIVQINQYAWNVSVDHQFAAVLEFGAIIEVTDKMRKWFAFKGFPLKSTTTIIEIPARPFMDPAIDQMRSEFPEMYKEASS